MKKTLNTLATVVAVVGALSLSAAAQAQSETKVNPWKQCGIGAMIFDDNPTVAAISNIIWDLGTTAVTSASASEDSCEGAKVVAAQFITETYASIEHDLVKGKGDHLSAMLNIMSCSDDSAQTIRTELAVNLANDDFANASTEAKAESLYNITEAACSKS